MNRHMRATMAIIDLATPDAAPADSSADAAALRDRAARADAPLALYIHWPFCVSKCPYCDFNSHEAKGELPEQEYLDAVRLDLEQSLPLIWGRKIHTVFIGGGTPDRLRIAIAPD